MICPTCGGPCTRLDSGVVARGRDGGAVALERSLALLEKLARDSHVGLLAVRDLQSVLRERIRTGETDDDVTVIERVWECRASEACIVAGPVRIERETRIVEDLGATRRRAIAGKLSRGRIAS